jgi:hypothetical protein
MARKHIMVEVPGKGDHSPHGSQEIRRIGNGTKVPQCPDFLSLGIIS